MIKMQNVRKVYPGFDFELSMEIPEGRITGLIGKNGAGKSTTIRGILGLIRRECGEVLFCGEPLSTDSVAMKEQIGVVFDSLCFSPELTVEKAGKICRSIYSNWDEAYFQELLQQFSLLPKQKIKELSRGMSMKLSLVLAFAHHPKLLILDEPTSGLDPVVRDDLLDLFLEFVQDEEHAILISTHITSDLEKVADYVTFLHAGKLLLSKPKGRTALAVRHSPLRRSIIPEAGIVRGAGVAEKRTIPMMCSCRIGRQFCGSIRRLS